MQTIKQLLLYGFLVWLIPFLVAIVIFPLRTAERPFFESIMPVVIALSTVIALHYYQKIAPLTNVKDAILVSLVWIGICLVIDLALFSWGPMKMAISDYWKDIGFTYLLIPVIVIGANWSSLSSGEAIK